MTTIEEFIFTSTKFVLGLSFEKVAISFILVLFFVTLLLHLDESSSIGTKTYAIMYLGGTIVVLLILGLIWVF